jgi:hypothetical protein
MIGREDRKGCFLSLTLSKLYCQYFTKEDAEGFGDFNIGGQVTRTLKYADDLVLP